MPRVISIRALAFLAMSVLAVGLIESPVFAAEKLKLSPNERAYLSAKSHISMCGDPNWMPYEKIDADGRYTGLISDFMRLISTKIDTPIVLHPTETWSQTIADAKSGHCDIIAALNASPERREHFNFTTPYVTSILAIITRDSEFYVNDISALGDKKIALVKGYRLVAELSRLYPNLKIVLGDNEDQTFSMVSSGGAYATIATPLSASYVIKKLALANLKVSGAIDIDFSLRTGVLKKNADLHSIMDAAIRSVTIMESNEIYQKWLSVQFDQQVQWQQIAKYVFAAIAIVILVLAWNYKLRNLNQSLRLASEELERQKNLLREAAIRDQLTGVYNRRRLEDVLETETLRANRASQPFSVILIDVDFFKSVNDTHGHQVGDQVLKDIAQELDDRIRRTDTFGRWGGEEFIVLCPNTDGEGARQMAEGLRSAVENKEFKNGLAITASFGIAVNHGEDDKARILERADRALYQAKKNGRNRIELGN